MTTFTVWGNMTIFTVRGNMTTFTVRGNMATFTVRGNMTIFAVRGNMTTFTVRGNTTTFPVDGLVGNIHSSDVGLYDNIHSCGFEENNIHSFVTRGRQQHSQLCPLTTISTVLD